MKAKKKRVFSGKVTAAAEVVRKRKKNGSAKHPNSCLGRSSSRAAAGRESGVTRDKSRARGKK